jgi:hypothetical protein
MMQATIVATDLGSLPDGGFEDQTPIYQVSEHLLKKSSQSAQGYQDLSFGDKLAFQIDGVISPDESRRLIEYTEALGFRQAAPGIQTPPGMRQNTTVHWMAHPRDVEILFSRIEEFVPPEIENRQSMGALSHRFNTYRYTAGQQFRPHLDGDWPGFSVNSRTHTLEYWKKGRSMLSMLLYLNGREEGVVGGDTLLLDGQTVMRRVNPVCGRALFFRHGIHAKSVLHAGDVLAEGTSKYVVRINVMYQ